MAENVEATVEDYLLVLRIIQPARIQDIKRMYPEILGVQLSEDMGRSLSNIHALLRERGAVVSVRRGTYVLDAKGMELASKQVKVRKLDNARLFLMKSQRRVYR